MATTIKLKRGLAASWVKLNPILAPGEPGFELDTGLLKIGNGHCRWNDLPYIGGGSGDLQEEWEVINRPTHYDFPSVGRPEAIYKAEKEKKLYQWNTSIKAYEVICESEGGDYEEPDVIHGGGASGLPE